MNFIKYLSITSLLFTISTFAQTSEIENDKLSLNGGTLENQFEYVIRKSNGWDNNGQPYRVVKSSWLADLKTHTLDTLKVIRKNLIASEITVKAQALEITNLKNSLSNTVAKIDKTKVENNTLSLFGMPISKGLYSVIMWAIISIILAFLILFIYKFKNSNAITIQSKQALLDLEEEFEEHRKIAVEREQKVRRQLQDEINKQKSVVKPKK